MIPLEDVVAFITRDMSLRNARVGAYWYECPQGRQEMRHAIAKVDSSVFLVPLVPQVGFDNPNAISTDLASLLDTERASVEEGAQRAARDGRSIALVLIARTRLREPLIGSAVTMPDWFPYCGGSVLTVDIVDVASSATALLKSQVDALTNLQISLYEIEGLLLDRLEAMRSANHNVTNQFFSEILSNGENAKEFLVNAGQRHRQQTAKGFRAAASPSSKELLGRLVGRVGELSPGQLPKLGEGLFAALGLTEKDVIGIPEPLVAVALRSTRKDVESDRTKRCARNVVLAAYCASQVVTAAAHAGEYGEFRVIALRSFLLELRAVLSGFKNVLG